MRNLSFCRAAFALYLSCSLHLAVAQSRTPLSQLTPAQRITLPIIFEENQGQGPANTRFIARNVGGDIRFTNAGPDISTDQDTQHARIQLRVLGSHSGISAFGVDELPGKANYFIGRDESRWRSNIPTFGKVAYFGILPGVDLIFYGTNRQLEHDFIVAPGADPAKIIFTLAGAEKLSITPSGDLSVSAGDSVILFQKPVAYQKTDGDEAAVDASFQIGDSNTVSFSVGKYDHNYALVIDPVLTFSTYLDGSYADTPLEIATDSSGNIYEVGLTQSPDFPLSAPYQAACGGCQLTSSGYISKLDPTGRTLLYSTYFGGGGAAIDDIVIDSSGNLVGVGYTASSDIPQVGNFASPSTSGIFVFSLDAAGSKLNYSEIIGTADSGYWSSGLRRSSLAVDSSSNVYVVGVTLFGQPNLNTPTSIPMTPGTYANSVPAATQALVAAKLAADGSQVYGTVIPAVSSDNGFILALGGITIDPQGDLYISGTAYHSIPEQTSPPSGLPVTPGVLGPVWTSTDTRSGYALALNSSASKLIFSTYLPGTDIAGPLVRAADGTLYVAGMTSELNLPVSTNAFQKTPSTTFSYDGANYSCLSGYIFHLDALGTTVLGATYLSGPLAYITGANDCQGFTYYESISFDSSGNVYVAGNTSSTAAPLLNPIVSFLDMTGNATDSGTVLEGLTPGLSQLVFGSYFNGVGAGSQLTAMTIDSTNHMVFTGTTYAYQNFPTTAGVVQPNAPTYIPPGAAGYPHQYVASINLTTAPDFTLATGNGGSSQTVKPGGAAFYTFSISPAVGYNTPVVTLTASGLPSGATAAVSPSPVPAGIGVKNVTMVVDVPSQSAMGNRDSQSGGKHAWFVLGFLLLPFAGRDRRTGRSLGRLIIFALLLMGMGGAAELTGCGSGGGSSGGGGGSGGKSLAGAYNITVTATSGTFSHSVSVILTVE